MLAAERVALARHVGIQVLAGVLYLHVVPKKHHRAISPATVLLRSDGRVKIDGWAAAEATRDITAGAAYVDVLHYSAPEVIGARVGGPSPASDVWAVGVLLLELVTGRHPWHGTTLFQQAAALNEAAGGGGLPAPWPEVELLDPQLAHLLRACTATDPSKRIPADAAMLHPFFAASPPGDDAAADAPLVAFLTERGVTVDPKKPARELQSLRKVLQSFAVADSPADGGGGGTGAVPTRTEVVAAAVSARGDPSREERRVAEAMKRLLFRRLSPHVRALAQLLRELLHDPRIRCL